MRNCTKADLDQVVEDVVSSWVQTGIRPANLRLSVAEHLAKTGNEAFDSVEEVCKLSSTSRS